VFKKVSPNLFDGLSDGIAFAQLCHKITEGQAAKAGRTEQKEGNVKVFANAQEGSELAKRNIQASIAAMKRLGVPAKAMFDVDDLALLKNPRKVVNALAALCSIMLVQELFPNIQPFPTVVFEVDEQRIAGERLDRLSSHSIPNNVRT
jgi:hypothetical protein